MADGAHAIAVKGDFDDCQALVKSAFNDGAFRDEVGQSAVNSINGTLDAASGLLFRQRIACGRPG